MVHILLVTYPAQGHVNPTLQLAKRLLHVNNVQVTFATTIYTHNQMLKHPTPISFLTFSDGYDDGNKPSDRKIYVSHLEEIGSRTLTQQIQSLTDQSNPISFVIYDFLLPWVAHVAQHLSIPSAMLWLLPYAVFSICYHYFNGSFQLLDACVELPGLPLLNPPDLPSFFHPSNAHLHVLPRFRELFEGLGESQPRWVLVNSFDALESEELRVFQGMGSKLLGIGPLIPSAFLDESDPTDTSFGGDLWRSSGECMEWLDSKPASSVVYVAFGSLVEISKEQVGEIAKGLSESNRNFLWVIRAGENGVENGLPCGFEEVVGERGMVVTWAPQIEVLSHVSVGCFVTHCGWNSTLEALVMGVPMVCFPQRVDQPTNAKLVEDVWKMGVRVEVRGDGVLVGEELERCLGFVMDGESGGEIKKKVREWRDLAKKAVKTGGSSNRDIKAFVDEVKPCIIREKEMPTCNGKERIEDDKMCQEQG